MTLIIRHYDNPHSAREAIEALKESGIPDQRVGFLTKQGVAGHFHVPPEVNPNDMSGREGAALGTLAGLVVGAAAVATPLGPLLAAGPLFGTLIGALAGAATGGIVARLVDAGVSEELARRLAATLESDEAVLLSVEVPRGREAEVRALLAKAETMHADEQRYFERYHETHHDTDFEAFSHAYHFGYRAAAAQPRPFDVAEATLRAQYPGDYDRDRDAIRVGYQRFLDTVQIVER